MPYDSCVDDSDCMGDGPQQACAYSTAAAKWLCQPMIDCGGA
jgi:hypothetical protein